MRSYSLVWQINLSVFLTISLTCILSHFSHIFTITHSFSQEYHNYLTWEFKKPFIISFIVLHSIYRQTEMNYYSVQMFLLTIPSYKVASYSILPAFHNCHFWKVCLEQGRLMVWNLTMLNRFVIQLFWEKKVSILQTANFCLNGSWMENSNNGHSWK